MSAFLESLYSLKYAIIYMLKRWSKHIDLGIKMILKIDRKLERLLINLDLNFYNHHISLRTIYS